MIPATGNLTCNRCPCSFVPRPFRLARTKGTFLNDAEAQRGAEACAAALAIVRDRGSAEAAAAGLESAGLEAAATGSGAGAGAVAGPAGPVGSAEAAAAEGEELLVKALSHRFAGLAGPAGAAEGGGVKVLDPAAYMTRNRATMEGFQAAYAAWPSLVARCGESGGSGCGRGNSSDGAPMLSCATMAGLYVGLL